jgi:PHD/YefM family antitoxin component YafN of YafNO toxin-antitoxin module
MNTIFVTYFADRLNNLSLNMVRTTQKLFGNNIGLHAINASIYDEKGILVPWILTVWYNSGIIKPRKELKIMPQIIPIRDLKNTSEISQMCRESKEPIFVTKNGYGDMVIMSMEMYKEKMFMLDVYDKLLAAEEQIKARKVLDGEASLKSMREKYNV